jgi:hypothetical protein
VLDRVVDGGLFDTSGAVTAFELAFAMRKITAEDSQSGLYPYVIQISADPQLFPDKEDKCGDKDEGLYLSEPQLPDAIDYDLFGAAADPATVLQSRTARGYNTLLKLRPQLGELNSGLKNEEPKRSPVSHAFFRVCPQPKDQADTWTIFASLWREKDKNDAAAPPKTRTGWKEISMS